MHYGAPYSFLSIQLSSLQSLSQSVSKGWSVYFRDMFCAGRVVEEDLKRTMKACGGSIQTSVNNMTDDVLGRCELFEEEQIGGERYMHAITY